MKDGSIKNTRFNDPQDDTNPCKYVVIYYERNNKYYTGILSPLLDTVDAFEFTKKEDAYRLFFTWTYLSCLEQEDYKGNIVTYIPDNPNYFYDEDESVYFKFPKEVITKRFKGYNAFVGEQLFMAGKWHDLSNGKTWTHNYHTYSVKDGILMCDGTKCHLENNVNTFYKFNVYHNGDLLLKELYDKGYSRCSKCMTYRGKNPIEIKGYHLSPTSDTSDKCYTEKITQIPDNVFVVKKEYPEFEEGL